MSVTAALHVQIAQRCFGGESPVLAYTTWPEALCRAALALADALEPDKASP